MEKHDPAVVLKQGRAAERLFSEPLEN